MRRKAVENIRITEHGVKLLGKLAEIRKAFETLSEDLSYEEQDKLNSQYIKSIHPYETQIIEEIFDANYYETRQPELIQMHNEGIPTSLEE
jgi:hypothetical protein